MRVFVYFNLHKKCYSVKALEGENKGRVIAHADRVMLSDDTFKVSEAGRQRVLRTKRKNVHAGVVGQYVGHKQHAVVDRMTENELNAVFDDVASDCVKVTYNPYKFTSFVCAADTRLQMRSAATCYINERGVFAKNCVYYIPELDMTKGD